MGARIWAMEQANAIWQNNSLICKTTALVVAVVHYVLCDILIHTRRPSWSAYSLKMAVEHPDESVVRGSPLPKFLCKPEQQEHVVRGDDDACLDGRRFHPVVIVVHTKGSCERASEIEPSVLHPPVVRHTATPKNVAKAEHIHPKRWTQLASQRDRAPDA
jgi:hypothetical protein